MLNDHAIAAAFAHSSTPCLVVTSEKFPIIVAANKTWCTWMECTREALVNKALSDSSTNLLKTLAISESQLSHMFDQVISTQAAVKGNIKKKTSTAADTTDQRDGSFYEIFPIIEDSKVVYFVLQIVFNSEDLLSSPPIQNNYASTTPSASVSASNQPLELLIDSLSTVIFTLDIESPGIYKFSFANRAFQVTTGLPVDKVIGKYVHEIIPEPSLSMVLEKYKEAIEEKKQVSWEEVSQYPAGQKIGEVLVVPVLDADGNCFRLAGLVHDITPFKEAEANQARLTQDLYQQNRDLQQFTYIISHNLRAPLANALGLVRHLPNIVPDSALFKQYVSFLTTSIENLDTILADLNQILSIRDRKDFSFLESVSLVEVCSQAVKALEVELLQADGQLNINIDPNFRVQANRAYIYSICYNLLSNAIKYRSNDRPLYISVWSENGGDEGPVIHFTDNGAGLEMEKVGTDLFKLYARFHNHVEGRGMGLFLVKTHLEAVGGHIKVESKLNKGTTFSIFFKELV